MRPSLECEPDLAVELRRTCPAVRPGYHLNKRHWNTITLDGSLPDGVVRDLVEDSYDLVVGALPRRVRDELLVAEQQRPGSRRGPLERRSDIGDARCMSAPRESISARVRRWAASLGPFDYAATVALLAIYGIGTSMDDGPGTDMAYYQAVATVIPGLLIAVAIQGRVFVLSRKLTFRWRYRTVLLAIVVFGGEAGTLMTLARQKTNWAAHLYVYLAVLGLGVAMLYLALAGIQQAEPAEKDEPPDAQRPQSGPR